MKRKIKMLIASLIGVLVLGSSVTMLSACGEANTNANTNEINVNGDTKENSEISETENTESTVSKSEITTVELGETISTDIWEFTLKDIALSVYASSIHDGTYGKPIEQSDGGIFVAGMGNSLVCLSFEVKNKDRISKSIGDGGIDGWGLGTLSVVSGNDEYQIRGFNLYYNEGIEGIGLRFDFGTINGAKRSSTNYIMEAGQTIDAQVVGVITEEKDNLSDTYSLKIGVPNSSGEREYFEYMITK